MAISDWVQIFTQVIAVSTLIVVLFQTRYMRIEVQQLKKDFKDDHERSRRENAINLILEFSKELKRETSSARKLVELLDKEKLKRVMDEKELKISKEYIGNIKSCLGEEGVLYKVNGDLIEIASEGSSLIRWHTMRYLNLLEAIMSSRKHNVSEKEMIDEQFLYLLDEMKGYSGMKAFRELAGVQNFPSTEYFVQQNKQKLPGIPPKPSTGTERDANFDPQRVAV